MLSFLLPEEYRKKVEKLTKVLQKVLARRRVYLQKIAKQRETLKKVVKAKSAVEQERNSIKQEKEKALAEKDRNLQEVVHHVREMKQVLENLRRPPNAYARFLRSYPERSADVLTGGKEIRIPIDTTVNPDDLKMGVKVILSSGETIAIIGIAPNQEGLSYKAKFIGFYGDHQALIEDSMGSRAMVYTADSLDIEQVVNGAMVQVEDGVVVDLVENNFIDLGKKHSKYALAEMPNVSLEDIGGLESQINGIIEDIEDPFIFPELYEAYALDKHTNTLLYGLPGNGKTLIAKLIAKLVFDKYKDKILPYANGNFFAISGPELADMWVGKTEEKIRDIFDAAGQLVKDSGVPVFVFFDDCESFLRRRGSSISSDVKDDYVTQFTTCVDGIKELKGVNIILATNRIDLIDAAVVRRMDIKLRIPSPNSKERAADVFRKHLSKTKISSTSSLEDTIAEVVGNIFDGERSDYLEIHFRDDTRKIFHLSDMLSGKIIADIVKRAKKIAKNRDKALPKKQRPTGVTVDDLKNATETEFLTNESLPSNDESIRDWLQQLGQTTEVASYRNLWKEKRTKSEDSFDLTQ